MVVDTSAIAAILLDEPDAPVFARAIEAAPVRLLSVMSRVELSLVIESRKGEGGRLSVDQFLAATPLDIVSMTPQHAALAIEAFRRFGKGRHRAALNIGDCFAYALAKATGMPLLFKGDDFVHTDVRVAAPPV